MPAGHHSVVSGACLMPIVDTITTHEALYHCLQHICRRKCGLATCAGPKYMYHANTRAAEGMFYIELTATDTVRG